MGVAMGIQLAEAHRLGLPEEVDPHGPRGLCSYGTIALALALQGLMKNAETGLSIKYS